MACYSKLKYTISWNSTISSKNYTWTTFTKSGCNKSATWHLFFETQGPSKMVRIKMLILFTKEAFAYSKIVWVNLLSDLKLTNSHLWKYLLLDSSCNSNSFLHIMMLHILISKKNRKWMEKTNYCWTWKILTLNKSMGHYNNDFHQKFKSYPIKTPITKLLASSTWHGILSSREVLLE